MMKYLYTLISFVTVSGIVLSSRCSLEPAGPPSASDLVGKWIIFTAATIYTETIYTAATDRDSVVTRDTTTINYTNSDNYYSFYRDMTYYTQFEGTIIGYNGMFTDTGSWAVYGSTLQTISPQTSDTLSSALSLDGDNVTIVSRIRSYSLEGPNAGDSLFYNCDLVFSAVKQ